LTPEDGTDSLSRNVDKKLPLLFLTPEDGTDSLSRNVDKKLPLLFLTPEDGTDILFETSLTDHKSTLPNIPEERVPQEIFIESQQERTK
jgi:hypothetical protein